MNVMGIVQKIVQNLVGDLSATPEEIRSGTRYFSLKRNMIVLMTVVTVVPLVLMAAINYFLYQHELQGEVLHPLKLQVNKTQHSLELFLRERLSAMNFIVFSNSYDQLAAPKALQVILRAAKKEFHGFVDMGLVNDKGEQVNYVGPYNLKGKNYAEQDWFQEVRIRGAIISDVFLGYRKFPHIVLAVERFTDSGERWYLRATIDTKKFDDLLAELRISPMSDAFLINRQGVLQSTAKYAGTVMGKSSFSLPPFSYQPMVTESVDALGNAVYLTSVNLSNSNLMLMLVKPESEVLSGWSTIKNSIIGVFCVSIVIIFLVIFKLTDVLVNRIRESDQKRDLVFRQMEHTQKLSSIGRLAAGVAHEINNPLAIINEKAGLMKDIMGAYPDMPAKDKFMKQVEAIINSVVRCRTITHRLLGFARRMEVQTETLDLNEVLSEVMGFLEKEAMYRKVNLDLTIDEHLPLVRTDRGQVQQVFLNILNNALAAVEDEGEVKITTFLRNESMAAVSIQDNGCGMAKDTLMHVFEPFFSTKGSKGTGLGLSITYGIVKKLGGDIEVESAQGQGTTFTVLLPTQTSDVVE